MPGLPRMHIAEMQDRAISVRAGPGREAHAMGGWVGLFGVPATQHHPALNTQGIGTTGALSTITYAGAIITVVISWFFLRVAAACFIGSSFVHRSVFVVSFVLHDEL